MSERRLLRHDAKLNCVKTSQAAFTFFETMIALLIVIMLAVMSLPSLKDFVDTNQDAVLQQQLLAAIALAKAEAQLRHVPVSICQSNNQETCSGNWENGQLVFVDASKTGTVRSQKDIISIFPPSSHGSLHWHSFQRHDHYLIFLPGEFGNNNGTFWHCHDSKIMWAIKINKADRARITLQKKDFQTQALCSRPFGSHA